jgi:hypothetical protein
MARVHTAKFTAGSLYSSMQAELVVMQQMEEAHTAGSGVIAW